MKCFDKILIDSKDLLNKEKERREILVKERVQQLADMETIKTRNRALFKEREDLEESMKQMMKDQIELKVQIKIKERAINKSQFDLRQLNEQENEVRGEYDSLLKEEEKLKKELVTLKSENMPSGTFSRTFTSERSLSPRSSANKMLPMGW